MNALMSDECSDIKQEVKNLTGSELDTDLVHIKKLIDTYKPKTCIEFIENLINKKWDNLQDKIKFKLLTNKASCLLQQGKYEEATFPVQSPTI